MSMKNHADNKLVPPKFPRRQKAQDALRSRMAGRWPGGGENLVAIVALVRRGGHLCNTVIG